MRAILLLAGCALLAGASAARGDEKTGIGEKIADIRLTQLDGKPLALHALKDRKAIVVVFLTFDCPVATSYLAELTKLAGAYPEVAFLGVCPGAEDRDQLARQAREFQVGFPVVHDPHLHGADAFRAGTTPEAFVLDRQFLLRYRGRIGDTWGARLKKNRAVTRQDLRQALDEVLAGKAVSQPVTAAVGCPIVRAEERKVNTKVTYSKDVLPILQKHCQACHRPGESGPFSLLTYAQAVRWADSIKEYTQDRRMPPWKPTSGVALSGERKLSDPEIATLAAWADGGTPQGDPRDAPPPVKFAEGWTRGEPDLILTPKEDFTLGATGSDHYRVFVFPLDLPEDKFVAAYEVRPGNRAAVHHTVHFIDLKGRARKLEQRHQERPRRPDERDFGPGYPSRMGPGFFPPDGDLGGWAPGISPPALPDGVAYYLPKGSDFIAHVHYHRTGKVEKDKTQIGLYFAKNAVNQPIQHLAIGGLFLAVPPGEANYPVKGSLWIAQDCTLHTVTPHMHLIGKKIKITMTPPGGPTTTLVGIDDWDFNWQEIYRLKEPLKVKADTRFDVEGVFDNSAKNPNNPFSPPRRITLGESTNNEMCFGFLGLTIDEPGAVGFRLWSGGLVLRRPGVLPKAP
jgi:peroxiredoxin